MNEQFNELILHLQSLGYEPDNEDLMDLYDFHESLKICISSQIVTDLVTEMTSCRMVKRSSYLSLFQFVLLRR